MGYNRIAFHDAGRFATSVRVIFWAENPKKKNALREELLEMLL
jgi:hypothetical protein